jgi:hypothetical protein
MHVEGIAFYIFQSKPGYVPVSFTDEDPAAVYGVPVAIIRGERVTGGHRALARAVLGGRSAQSEPPVAVYVGPHTTDLEISFLWISGFRARKVRPCEVTAARRHWQIAACRHYAQTAGLARRSLRVEGGQGHDTGKVAGLRVCTADRGRGGRRAGRGEGPGDRRQDAAERGVRRRLGVA